MTKVATHSEQTVEALLAERQRYDAWLAALEQRRDSTPSHIYDRVHADYAARLQRVVEELAKQRSALQKLEHTLMDRLTSLDVEEAQHRDEAAEAALRAAVGELTAEQHDEVTRRTEAALAEIEAARQVAVPELTRIRAALERGHHERATEPEPEPAPSAPAVPRTPPAGFDELNFLKSLVDTRSDAANGSQPDDHAVREWRTSAASAGTSGETTSPPAPGAPPNPSGAVPVQRERGTTQVEHEEAPYLKDVRAEQVKTLKCQECGTLNYPTEWYCERCGAELAAL